MAGLSIVSVVLLLSALFQCSLGDRLKYPAVRRDESVVDDYYGWKVPDPYRYLEATDSDEVKGFVEAQNKLTDEYLSKSLTKEAIEKKITEVYNYPKYGVPRKYGSRYYFVMNTGLQNQDVYYVQDSLDSEPRVFFDPNKLSDDGTISLSDIRFSQDGELVVLGLSTGGSDWVSVRIMSTSSGQDFPEVLNDVKFSDYAWTTDNLGFFYARYPKVERSNKRSAAGAGSDQEQQKDQGTETTQYGNHKMYYHLVGTSQADDILVVEFDDPQLSMGYFEVTHDGKYLIITPFPGTDNCMVFYANLEEQTQSGVTDKLQLVPVVDNLENIYTFVSSEGSVIYLLTNNGAPNNRVVAIDLNRPEPENWSTLIPEHAKNLLEYAFPVNEDKLILDYLVDVKSTLKVHSIITGALIEELDLPVGTVDSFSGRRIHSEFFFRVVSFLTPGIIYRLDLHTPPPYATTILKEVKVPGFDASKFTTKQVFYPSKDGTLIPMFVVHKKDLKNDGEASTYLYGYGGFNINVLPSFRSDRIVFLQNFDGVYAVANIRGGGEYGQKWHEGGRLLNKQNVFDDFHAAAEYLVREGYTKHSKIAIVGASNGGLLVAACVNQRPELFGAGIAQVGVHDLLRYQKFTIGYAWCPEYGCSDDGNKTIFENLHKLSPLHNVRLPKSPRVQYPAMLLTTADHDDRVVPLHSYKLIAELQYKIGRSIRQTNPLLIRVQTSAGHGAGKPTSMKILELAEIYAFLVESAGFIFHD